MASIALRPSPGRVRLGAEIRHQSVLLARDPGPLIGYTVMPLLLIAVLRPLYAALHHGPAGRGLTGIDQAAAGMAVMFSLFALKIVGASLLNERSWGTWDRLRCSPARPWEILLGKALPMYVALLAQQAVLFAFAALFLQLRPEHGWWELLACVPVWSACVLLLGTAASTLARSPAQLSAAGDVVAIVTTILAGALVPSGLLPGWIRTVGVASPGYWAIHGYHAALVGSGDAVLRALAMIGVFGVLGVVLSWAITRRTHD
jgi:ABC-2 type transport system permease protein